MVNKKYIDKEKNNEFVEMIIGINSKMKNSTPVFKKLYMDMHDEKEREHLDTIKIKFARSRENLMISDKIQVKNDVNKKEIISKYENKMVNKDELTDNGGIIRRSLEKLETINDNINTVEGIMQGEKSEEKIAGKINTIKNIFESKEIEFNPIKISSNHGFNDNDCFRFSCNNSEDVMSNRKYISVKEIAKEFEKPTNINYCNSPKADKAKMRTKQDESVNKLNNPNMKKIEESNIVKSTLKTVKKKIIKNHKKEKKIMKTRKVKSITCNGNIIINDNCKIIHENIPVFDDNESENEKSNNNHAEINNDLLQANIENNLSDNEKTDCSFNKSEIIIYNRSMDTNNSHKKEIKNITQIKTYMHDLDEMKDMIIKFRDLSKDKKASITKYCTDKICTKDLKKNTSKFQSTIIDTLKSIFCFSNNENNATNMFEDINNVSPFIYKLCKYILINGSKHRSIFKEIATHPDIINIYPFNIDKGIYYELEKFTIGDNAMIFIAYIRKVMKGLFEVNIAKSIFTKYKEAFNNLQEYKHKRLADVKYEIQKYLPFTLSADRYELLVQILELIKSINDNYEETNVDTKTLALLFAPSLFANVNFQQIEDLKYASEIIEILCECDIENFDASVLRNFKKKNE